MAERENLLPMNQDDLDYLESFKNASAQDKKNFDMGIIKELLKVSLKNVKESSTEERNRPSTKEVSPLKKAWSQYVSNSPLDLAQSIQEDNPNLDTKIDEKGNVFVKKKGEPESEYKPLSSGYGAGSLALDVLSQPFKLGVPQISQGLTEGAQQVVNLLPYLAEAGLVTAAPEIGAARVLGTKISPAIARGISKGLTQTGASIARQGAGIISGENKGISVPQALTEGALVGSLEGGFHALDKKEALKIAKENRGKVLDYLKIPEDMHKFYPPELMAKQLLEKSRGALSSAVDTAKKSFGRIADALGNVPAGTTQRTAERILSGEAMLPVKSPGTVEGLGDTLASQLVQASGNRAKKLGEKLSEAKNKELSGLVDVTDLWSKANKEQILLLNQPNPSAYADEIALLEKIKDLTFTDKGHKISVGELRQLRDQEIPKFMLGKPTAQQSKMTEITNSIVKNVDDILAGQKSSAISKKYRGEKSTQRVIDSLMEKKIGGESFTDIPGAARVSSELYTDVANPENITFLNTLYKNISKQSPAKGTQEYTDMLKTAQLINEYAAEVPSARNPELATTPGAAIGILKNMGLINPIRKGAQITARGVERVAPSAGYSPKTDLFMRTLQNLPAQETVQMGDLLLNKGSSLDTRDQSKYMDILREIKKNREEQK